MTISVSGSSLDQLEQYRSDLEDLNTEVLPIIDEISVHTRKGRKALDGEIVDTLALSNEVVELGILNQRLSERLATAAFLKRGTKNFYEVEREHHKTRLVKGYDENGEKITNSEGKQVFEAAGTADSMKHRFVKEEFALANDCEHLYDQLHNLYKSTDKTIDTLRSKLSYEKSNERNA